MKQNTWVIRLEETADIPAIEALQAEAFGPGRFARTAFRVREGIPHCARLSFTGLSGPVLAGSVRLSPIMIGEARSLLLGPLTVAPEFKNRGLGRQLLHTVVQAAEADGHTSILLVGDEPYYGPFGFTKVRHGSIVLPGPVDPDRLLAACLNGAGPPAGKVQGGWV